MWLSSVLFPHPLPPMMTKISPRAIVNDRSCWITKSPYPIVSPSTAIRGAGGVSAGAAPLEAEDIEDHGEDAVHDDDENDRGDHGRGGRLADGGRAPPRLHPAQAPNECDQDAEDHALADADEKAGQ